MRPRTKILAGAGVAVVLAIIVCSTTSRPVPPEPVYDGRPLSQWLDGGSAWGHGVSLNDVDRAIHKVDSNAVPWLIWLLEKNSRGPLDRPLAWAEFQLSRYNKGSLVQRGLAKLAEKDGRRVSAISLLSFCAPGTCYEETAARAILKSKSPVTDSDLPRILALCSFTRRPGLVLPAICEGLTNGGMRAISAGMLSRFGSNAVSNVNQMALAEPGTNGPILSALSQLNRSAWTNCIEEKQRRH